MKIKNIPILNPLNVDGSWSLYASVKHLIPELIMLQVWVNRLPESRRNYYRDR